MKFNVTINVTHDIGEPTAALLRELCGCRRTRPPAGFSRIRFHESGHIVEGNILMAQGKPGEVATFESQFKNASGRVIEVANAEWSSSDEAVATVTPDAGDGTTTPKGVVTLVAEGDAIIKCVDPDPDDDPGTEGVVETAGMALCRDNTVVVGTMNEGTFGPPA